MCSKYGLYSTLFIVTFYAKYCYTRRCYQGTELYEGVGEIHGPRLSGMLNITDRKQPVAQDVLDRDPSLQWRHDGRDGVSNH